MNAEKDLQIDNDQDLNLEGSYIAGKLWNQWLIAGQIPTHWGPAHDGSLIRGDASRPVYGVTMQRAEQNAFANKWLAWIGPWQYQAFAGQLDDYYAVPDAKLIGLRVTAQPLPYLELGASRAIQWGGEGRPENFDSFWDALIGKDNVYGDTINPSNQIAGFDARLNLHPSCKSRWVFMHNMSVKTKQAACRAKKCIWLESIIHQVITICLSNCIPNGQTLVPMARYRAFPIIIVYIPMVLPTWLSSSACHGW